MGQAYLFAPFARSDISDIACDTAALPTETEL